MEDNVFWGLRVASTSMDHSFVAHVDKIMIGVALGKRNVATVVVEIVVLRNLVVGIGTGSKQQLLVLGKFLH